MPDKNVNLEKAGYKPVNNDIEFIKKFEEIATMCSYRLIELCWMTWLVQREGKMIRMEKYSSLLPKI